MRERTLVLEVYRQDAILRRVGEGNGGGGRRGEVLGFTQDAARRCRFVALNAGIEWVAWVDLTYPEQWPGDGREVKRQLNHFLTRLRQTVPGVCYLWVLEFQERGAPHFHILVSERVSWGWIAEEWFRIVGSGDERHRKAGTRVSGVRCTEAASKYLATYLSKGRQKVAPGGFTWPGRFWGSTRGLVGSPDAFLLEGKPGQDVKRTLRSLVERKAGKKLRGVRGNQGGAFHGVAGEAHRLGVRHGKAF